MLAVVVWRGVHSVQGCTLISMSVCSEDCRRPAAGGSGRIRRRPPRRSVQPERRAAVPEEAHGDAVSLCHASQSHRLQVQRRPNEVFFLHLRLFDIFTPSSFRRTETISVLSLRFPL